MDTGKLSLISCNTRRTAKQAVTKVKAQVVSQQANRKIALPDGFVETVTLFNFGDHFRVQTTCAAILIIARR